MKGKARRLLSWVCVLALCMSLLPVTALAAGDGSSTTAVAKDSVTESQNGVTVNKSVSQNADGSYQLTMEALCQQCRDHRVQNYAAGYRAGVGCIRFDG